MYGLNNGIPVSLKSIPSFGIAPQNQLTAAIQSLFWDGSQGWWYDDDDTSTLFQDSAGTTPVTAVEQFVGLQLDKSQGLVLGPEQVTNGDFSAGSTGWTVGAGWVVSGGTAAGSSIGALLTQSGVLTAGKWYQATIVISGWSGSYALTVGQTGNPAWTLTNFAANTYTGYFNSGTSADFVLRVATGNAVPGTITIDNVSVRELPGNHRYAPASGNRPVWSKRVNLLTKTEQFDDGAWSKSNVTVTANATTAPDGTLTADLLNEGTATGNHRVSQTAFSYVSGTTYTQSVFAKADTATVIQIFMQSTAFGLDAFANYDLTNGVLGTVGSSATATITNAGSGWYRITLTATATTTTTQGTSFIVFCNNSTTAARAPSYTGTDKQFFSWGADFRPANQATGTIPLYQRVNTSSDYDTNGFPGYLRADGIDDFLQTNTIGFNTVTSDGQPRRNLLDNPTQFDAAAWGKTNSTVTANSTIAPDGTFTADTLSTTAATAFFLIGQNLTVPANVCSIYAKAGTANFLQLSFNGDTTSFANFDLLNGSTGTSGGTATSTIIEDGNGWYRCSVSNSASTVTGITWGIAPSASATRRQTFTGTGAENIFIWGAQLEVGSTATAFQNIGTDKITLCAGVRKLSDASYPLVVEHSANANSNNGAFNIIASGAISGSAGWSYVSKGTASAQAQVGSGYASPITNVVTGVGEISTDTSLLRVNGTQVNSSTADQGTGNYGNYPAYFFRRGGTTLPFNGYEYGNIAVGKLLTADQLASLEQYMNEKTRAY